MLRNSLLLVLFSTGLFACGGGPDITAQLDDIEVELAAQAEVFCDCYAEFGWPSREMCVAFSTATPDPTIKACVVSAFEVDAKASSDYLDCVLAAQASFTTCGEATLVCADPSTVTACQTQFDAAIDACPQLPANVDAALDACFPQQ